MTIFGISLGTTRTGICVLKDGVLQRAELHRFKARWSDEKLTKIVGQYRYYVERYKPDAIMIKVPPPEKHYGAVKAVMDRVSTLAKEYGCDLDFITKSELKEKTATRKTAELIDLTRRLYPELTALYEKGMPGEHSYHKRLYEAVLGAHVYQIMHGSREIGKAD